MSILDDLIIDRSQEDVDDLRSILSTDWAFMNQEQKEKFLLDHKGAYNASDLNRVGVACNYLKSILEEYGYSLSGYMPPRTDWEINEIPSHKEMSDYILNIHLIKIALSVAQEIPQNMSALSFEGANNIEKLLIEAEKQMEKIKKSFLYSGTIYSGQFW